MSDPKEAIDWAKSLEGEAQEFVVHNAFHKAFEKDKDLAIGLLPELNGLPAPARLRALRSMRSHRMTLPQVESMLGWLKAQPDHETDLAEGYEGVVNRMAYLRNGAHSILANHNFSLVSRKNNHPRGGDNIGARSSRDSVIQCGQLIHGPHLAMLKSVARFRAQ